MANKNRARKIYLVALLVFPLAFVVGWWVLPSPVCECLSSLTIEEGMDPDQPVHEINATHVRINFPEFYELLEQAHAHGTSLTEDNSLIWKIWEYIEEVTGSNSFNDNILYREKTFQLHHGIQ